MESSGVRRDTGPAMSEENVEIVRDAFAAFTRGDIEGVLRLCDEDILIVQAPELDRKSVV